jgi:hypothetical protein
MTHATETQPPPADNPAQAAADDAASAIRRLAALSRGDQIDDTANALAALTAPDGPLDALTDLLTQAAAHLLEFEEDDADTASDRIDYAATAIHDAMERVDGALDYLTGLVED